MPKVGVVSLGCPKNLVDSEVMMGLLVKEGYELTPHTFGMVFLKGHEAVPLCISYSPDGSRVATAGQDQTIRIWRTSDWTAQEVLKGHTGTVNWVEFSPDGSQIVSGGDDKSVRIWSSSGGEPLQTISDHKAPVRTVAFSPDGDYLVSSSERDVRVYKKVMVNR